VIFLDLGGSRRLRGSKQILKNLRDLRGVKYRKGVG